MKKIYTLFDTEIKAEYDLYLINAVELKNYLLGSYSLSENKYHLFNKATRLHEDLERHASNNNYNIDLKTGTIEKNELESEMKSKRHSIDVGFENKVNKPVELSNNANDAHLMGYELMPLAISLKDRDMKNIKSVELLDGFRRMFYVNDVPDRDVLVKVYDKLDSKQWANAMLLFNSWKVAVVSKVDDFVDRGFKLSLFKHFGLDITNYSPDSLSMLKHYFDGNFYARLKNNDIFIEDLKFILDSYDKHISKFGERRSYEISPIFEEMYELIGVLRGLEFNFLDNVDGHTRKVITLEEFDKFLMSKLVEKHVGKIAKMSTPGHIRNYVEKNIRPYLFDFIRNLYGRNVIPEKLKKDFIKDNNCHNDSMPQYFVLSPNKKIQDVIDLVIKRKEERDLLKNNNVLF